MEKRLVDDRLSGFLDDLRSAKPAPGGGTASAVMGALGSALLLMVLNLTIGKKRFEEHRPRLEELKKRLEENYEKFLFLIDEDTISFNNLFALFRQKKDIAESDPAFKKDLSDATKYSIFVPLEGMRHAVSALEMAYELPSITNPNVISDVGVGIWALNSCFEGAKLNVLINFSDAIEKEYKDKILEEIRTLEGRRMESFNPTCSAVENALYRTV